MNAYARLAYLFLIPTSLLFISSCKQSVAENLFDKNLSDSIHDFKIDNNSSIQKFRCIIQNTSDNNITFYITPAEIDMLDNRSIVNSVVSDNMTGEEKSLALWKFVCKWRYHSPFAPTFSNLPHNPATLFNALQSGICDDANVALANLGLHVPGLPARVVVFKGHVAMEFFYDNKMHLFDADREIYYRDSTGNIASAEDLKRNPEIFDLPQVNSFHSKLVYNTINRKNKKAILNPESTCDDDWYKPVLNTYTSTVTLKKGETITYSIEPVSAITKKIFVDILENGGPYYRRAGELTRHFKAITEKGGLIFSESCPYSINQVAVQKPKGKLPVSVYYSPDSVHWYFKGIVSETSRVTFDPRIIKEHEIVLNYYLKFVPAEGNNVEGSVSLDLEIKNDFEFSDKLFFNNNLHSFKVKSLAANYQAINMQLDCQRDE